MAVIYGWTYAEFHARVGWDKGAEAVYNGWENYWAYQADAYIFTGTGVHITDANEILELQTVINNKMIQTNLYLKGEVNETPMQSGFYGMGFPYFNEADFVVLDKLKSIHSQTFARADNIRMGVKPDNIYSPHDRFYF